MKTFKIKNYKGNIVESLSKFQKSHKGMKIVEATEVGDGLKIKAEESKSINEAVSRSTAVSSINQLKKDWMAMNRKFINAINKLTVKYGYSYNSDRPQNAGENIVFDWCMYQDWYPGSSKPGDGQLYLFGKDNETLDDWKKRSIASAKIKTELIKIINGFKKQWILEIKKLTNKINKITINGNWSYHSDRPQDAGEMIVSDWMNSNNWYPKELYQYSNDN